MAEENVEGEPAAEGGGALQSWRRGPVLVLRINRPEAANSLSTEVISGLGSGLDAAAADPGVAAVVITGSGDRVFCAGMDLREFSEGGPRASEHAAGVAAYQRFIRDGCPKPVVAAVNGTAVAGGFELVLACDLAVAAEGARFGLAEVKRGLFPAGGGVLLGARIPLARAYELTLTGEPVDAATALSYGLVNRVVPSGEVLAVALEFAATIAGNGPLAVRAVKALVRAAASQPADAVWALQEQLREGVFASEDAREGARAFVERRAPRWQGR